LAKFANTDRLMKAQEAACDEIEDRGWLSEACADELKLAAWEATNPEQAARYSGFGAEE
jgi:hypothetical protein